MDDRDRRDVELDDEVRPEGRETEEDHSTSLLEDVDADELRRRWDQLQGRFVDDPQQAVAEADSLVDEVIRKTTDRLASHRSSLEDQWARGEEATTEDLRQALQRYRAFFQRMLATDL